MLETDYQAKLKVKIKTLIPGSIVLKNDAGEIQGFPDLTIFYKGSYALLEVKKTKNASRQPNQEYYINKMSKDTFARFIYPENEEEVINDLQRAWGIIR